MVNQENQKEILQPKALVIDVDGVMTTGHFLYSTDGKVMKIFGPDDNDALSLLKPYLNIQFVTADARGFEISERRIVHDMKFDLELVSTVKRVKWLKERYKLAEVIYIGDGIFDHYIMREVGYAIAPGNADLNAKKYAHFITKRNGGDRAVAEACLHILGKFFKPFNAEDFLSDGMDYSN